MLQIANVDVALRIYILDEAIKNKGHLKYTFDVVHALLMNPADQQACCCRFSCVQRGEAKGTLSGHPRQSSIKQMRSRTSI